MTKATEKFILGYSPETVHHGSQSWKRLVTLLLLSGGRGKVDTGAWLLFPFYSFWNLSPEVTPSTFSVSVLSSTQSRKSLTHVPRLVSHMILDSSSKLQLALTITPFIV